MGLITCPKCGEAISEKAISEKAIVYPHCKSNLLSDNL